MTFRTKLLTSIFAVVATTTAATLFISQSQNQSSYQAVIDELFRTQIDAFRASHEERLKVAVEQTERMAESVRLFAALEESDPEIYQIAGDELRVADLAFFRLLNAEGRMIPPPPDSRAGMIGSPMEAGLSAQMQFPAAGIPTEEQVGFMVDESGDSFGTAYSVVASTIHNFDKTVGVLVIGQPIRTREPMAADNVSEETELSYGLYVNGKLNSRRIPEAVRARLEPLLAARTLDTPGTQVWTPAIGGKDVRVQYNLLNPGSIFPPAHLVSVFPLDDLHRRQRALGWRIAGIGALGLVAAAVVALLFAQRLSRPVQELVRGTGEVRKGNYEVRIRKQTSDELGVLAESFNEMAEGLALKEKYRSILQVVTDRHVAEELIANPVRLGGEMRDVSVMFCDIRGFTRMTEGMDPAEVVAMLNHHMSALTQVVDQHNGVVDKFIGDAIMTVFGAPKNYGRDAESAVRCAWEMIGERKRLNESAGDPVRIGIGIASGPALAGCMGSESRNNYTVIGERVNLASRLCSAAGPMEVVVDETTYQQLPEGFQVEPMESLTLKGFSQPITAYKIRHVPS